MKTNSNDMKLASVIKFYRKHNKIKQFTIADALQITVGYYSKIERGQFKLAVYQLEIVAKVIGISAEIILFITHNYELIDLHLVSLTQLEEKFRMLVFNS